MKSKMNVGKIISDPFKDLADSGKLSGLLLILATVLSLFFSNSERSSAYLGIWQIEIGFGDYVFGCIDTNQ